MRVGFVRQISTDGVALAGLSGTRAGPRTASVPQSRSRPKFRRHAHEHCPAASARPRAREGGRRGRLRVHEHRHAPLQPPPPCPAPKSRAREPTGPRGRLRLAAREGGREARLPPRALAATPRSGLLERERAAAASAWPRARAPPVRLRPAAREGGEAASARTSTTTARLTGAEGSGSSRAPGEG
jgi:hypothetical protein